jgi:serine palmitoyltransferase
MSSTTTSLEPLFSLLSSSYNTLETNFYKIPGSAVVARYVKSSHRNDPGRTVLEIILIIFAIRTLLQSRTRADNSGKHFIAFDEKVSMPKALYYLSETQPSGTRKSMSW